MKNSVLTTLSIGLGTIVVISSAQAKPIEANKAKITSQKVILKPDIKIANQNTDRKKIGATFRLKIWVNPMKTDDRDAPQDSIANALENYGKLQINGQTYWEVKRADAHKPENKISQTFMDEGVLPISEDTKHNGGRKFQFSLYNSDKAADRKLAVSLRLYDSDTYNNDSSKDDLWGSFDYTFDPLKTGGGDWYWVWDSGQGQSSRFNVKIEKIEDIYESSSWRKPNIGKLQQKPKITDKIPSPGPVIKRVPKKVEVR
jgi:hypothetical protein